MTHAAPQPRQRPRITRAHFRSIALDLWRRGVTHYGAKAIVEVVRYHRILQGVDADGFRINNDYTSRLARRAIEDCPELSEFFELRQIKSA